MNTADPIRDRQKIREIKEELRATNSRDYLLFTMGINLALRASKQTNISKSVSGRSEREGQFILDPNKKEPTCE